MTDIRPIFALAAATALVLSACGSPPEVDVEVGEATPAAEDGGGARLADYPTDEQPSGLPEGHPPLDSGAAQALPPGHPQLTPAESALAWDVPEGWVAEPPDNTMRQAQYRVPGEAGDAECAVFYFGPGQGGDPQANVERWARQFAQPDGSDPLSAMSTERLDSGDVKVLLVETTGTYETGPMMGGSSGPLKDAMLLGAIAEGPDASWFFKLTGPRATVAGEREAFRGMVASLQAAG